jgi:cystathionine gamma-synthase
VSPHSRWSTQLLQAITTPAPLGDGDAIALEQASRDVNERVPQLDRHCLQLAQHLDHHSAVRQVLHPKNCVNFRGLMRPNAGYGCLLSFVLNDATRTQRVFDALRVSKGPSLGTHFTLACPYTQLAHYDELDWAADCGVPAHLLRVSVGLEDPNELWQRFAMALES